MIVMNALILTFFLLFSHYELIQLGDEIVTVEVVSSVKDRAKGLMGRAELAHGEGMLFVYSKPQILSFWMKGTLIPLSIGFFDEKRTLLNIEEMTVPEQGLPLKTYTSRKPALYALEVPKDWFVRHKIKPGMRFEWIANQKCTKTYD